MMDNYELIILSRVRNTSGPERPLCDWFGFDWTCIFAVTALPFSPLPEMTRNYRRDDSVTAFSLKKKKKKRKRWKPKPANILLSSAADETLTVFNENKLSVDVEEERGLMSLFVFQASSVFFWGTSVSYGSFLRLQLYLWPNWLTGLELNAPLELFLMFAIISALDVTQADRNTLDHKGSERVSNGFSA